MEHRFLRRSLCETPKILVCEAKSFHFTYRLDTDLSLEDLL